MLQAWVDDSGNRGDPPFIYSGFMSQADRWEAFRREWEAELHEPPAINYFHMVEAANGWGEFALWTHGAVCKKIEKLLPIICSHAECSIFAIAEPSEYEAIAAVSGIPREIDFYQFLSFHGLISGTLRHVKQYTDFFFDEDPKREATFHKYWPLVRQFAPLELQPWLQPQPLFRDDKKFNPLQASDLLAWNMHRMAVQKDDSWYWIIEIRSFRRFRALRSNSTPMRFLISCARRT